MDRVELEGFLSEGLSLAEIGRRVGFHEATVGYWLQKHRLEAVNRPRHASKGGIQRTSWKPWWATVRPSLRSQTHWNAARQRFATGWESTNYGPEEPAGDARGPVPVTPAPQGSPMPS